MAPVELNQQVKPKKYLGRDPVLLEVFGGQVTQYISKPFTGVYQQCQNDQDALVFQLANCGTAISIHDDHILEGRLDKASRSLSVSEFQRTLDGEVITTGRYNCRNLGHRYPSDVFYDYEAQ